MHKKLDNILLIALVLIFTMPMAVAWFLYINNPTWKGATVNHGELIKPLILFKNLNLKKGAEGKIFDTKQLHDSWHIVYVNVGPCQQECWQNIHKMRQIRLALGKDQNRVGRILVTETVGPADFVEKTLKDKYPGTIYLWREKNKESKNSFYLVDPRGYLMMAYPSSVTHKEMYEDLKRLLRAS